MKAKVIGALVGLVVVGAILFANFGDLSQGREIMPTLFLCFFGLIVAVQIIPAILLCKVLVKELFGGSPKVKEETAVDVLPGD